MAQHAQALSHGREGLPHRRLGTLTGLAAPDLPIARNTALLSASLAANSGMLQLQAAVASITLVQVLDIDGLLGLGPAIVLACGALTAPFAGPGDGPDRAACRCWPRASRSARWAGVVAAIGSAAESAVLVFAAFVLIGMACRHGAAGAHRGRRHVPAGAARSRHRARVVRRGVRRDPRPGRVRPAARGQGAGRRRARSALAGRLGVHGRRAGARADGAPRPAPDRRPAPHRRAAARHRRAAAADHPPAGRDPGAAGGAGELRRDGRRDDAHRGGRRRPPAPRRAQRVPDHRRARARHVRARARGRAHHRRRSAARCRCRAASS